MDTEKIGKNIVVEGCVQGVGFRPHVYRLARRFRIDGDVGNVGGSVRIRAGGLPGDIAAFIAAIGVGVEHARVQRLRVADAEPPGTAGFAVTRSESEIGDNRCVSPDLSLCAECAAELARPGRRHRHFFNTCTNCGPRFSILRALPYDRSKTSMADFAICPECAAEYDDPDDRRFHAETICCNECGPTLFCFDGKERRRNGEAFDQAAGRLERGGIALIKGVGGYHLACSPYSTEAASTLRRIKGRDRKPFAVMYPDFEQVERHCRTNECEREALLSPPRPIVPLLLRDEGTPFAPGVLRGNARCGCFLPYTPLHQLLLNRTGPLVMTSANASGSPIIFEDGEAIAFLRRHRRDIACILYHDRPIERPIEDSVVEASEVAIPRVLRRSRGFAPASIPLPEPSPALLALGGDLKSSFCLARGDQAFLSQYFGDLEDAGAYENYEREIEALTSLLSVEPELAVCDLHPGYLSSRKASAIGLPLIKVQHHHAHIASVMAEARLDGAVIGASFDGTGYGDDGAIWGGEFLLCDGGEYRRLAHLEHAALAGGDQAARDARQTAACLLIANGIPVPGGLFPDTALLESALANGIGCAPSSSMGRLFDAIAAILGVASINDYEGQCAIALQQRAEAARRRGQAGAPLAFAVEERDGAWIVGFGDILRDACACALHDRDAFALGFHTAVADMVATVFARLRRRERVDRAVLSGGVFQNSLLLGMCRDELTRNGFSVYFNRLSPPNDGGIALGQALIGARLARRRKE